MKVKFWLIFIVSIILFLLTLPVRAQDNADLTRAETEFSEAKERLQTANKNYEKAFLEGNADARNEAKTALAKATEDFEYKEKVLNLLKGQSNQQSSGSTVNPNPNPTKTPTPTSTPTPPVGSSTSTDSNTTSSSDNLMIVECDQRVGVYNKRICTIAKNAASQPTPRVMLGTSATELGTVIFAQLINRSKVDVSEDIRKFILNAEEARTDKQVGSDSNSKGTTSLVLKGGVPAVFNIATEAGAMTSSVSGTTLTFRFNPVGFFEAISNSNYDFIDNFVKGFKKIPITDINKATLTGAANSALLNTTVTKPTDSNVFKYENKRINYFRKLAVGLSFDVSRGQTTPTFTGDDRQLSAFSLKYEFLNERDPRHPKYAEAWRNFFIKEGSQLIEETTATEAQLLFKEFNEGFKDEDLQKWLDELNNELKNITSDTNLNPQQAMIKKRLAIEAKIIEKLGSLPVDKLVKNSDFVEGLKKVTNAFIEFNKKRKALLDEIAKAPVISFEYINNREPVLPDTHSFNFILAKGFSVGGSVMDATFNASLTFFNKKPVGTDVKRIRDFSFAGQLDFPIGKMLLSNEDNPFYNTTFSFAGKYQRLTGNVTALDGTVLPNTKGDIWVGQAKLIIPFNLIPGLEGIRIPISASFANRTELIRESRVRGNFGITFDIDKLILSHFLNNIR